MKQKITKNERTTALWAKIHVRLLLALLVGLLAGTGTAWADDMTGVNLLTNGDCASNTFDGWTCSATGYNYLQGANGCWQSSFHEVSMTQTVNLPDKGFTVDQLDNGSLSLIASGDLALCNGGARKAIIKVECLDVNGNVLSGDGATTYLLNITEKTAIASEEWQTYGENLKLPSTTRQIRYSVTMMDYPDRGGFYGPKFDNAVIMLLTSKQNVSHKITTDTPTNGTLTVANPSSLPSKTVSVDYTSETGYYMTACNISYNDGNGTAHTQALAYDKTQTVGAVTFVMPAADVRISATFATYPTVTIGSTTGTDITAPANAAPGSTVTFNVTPTAGNIGSVSYTSNGGTETPIASGIWYPQTLTFTMPATDVTINGRFAAMTSTADLTVNMPKTGTLALNIPAAYNSLKIYNDGGAFGVYSNNCNGTLELTAPENYVINLKGTVNAEPNCDYLYFYDGFTTKNSVAFTSIYENVNVNMYTTTTGNTAKLNFTSNGSGNHYGMQLDVKIYGASDKHTITLSDDAKNAGISTLATNAYPDSVITLNVTPAAGTIGRVSYKTANGTTTELASDIWYPQTVTFTMPASNVTINGSFEKITDQTELTVNIPRTGTISASIPAAYKSLKIYDDGGASGNYWSNCNGFLELTAPENYVINLKGTVNAEHNRDYLYFYDGITAKDNVAFTDIINGNNVVAANMNITTTGNTAKLNFTSNEGVYYSGIDLEVVLKVLSITATPDATMTIDGNTAPGYWATLYTVVPRTIPEGVTAYYIQDGTANDAFAKLVKLTGKVLPAGNGYLLNYNTSAELSFAYTETVATDNVTGNLLKGGATATTDNESGYLYYILGRIGTSPNYTYGFYWQNSDNNGGVTDGTKVVSAANKAYLKVPHTTGGAKSMALTFGDGTTGISNTAASAQENGAWYTLQGVRLTAEPTQSGLYIHNKKKVIIK